MNRFVRLLLPAVILAGVASCGGGSGSGGAAAPRMATVGVALTDAPAPSFDQALATITSIQLIGDAAPVTLFSGTETVDLLKLADYAELFAVNAEVPPGTYSKIRLQLSALELVRLDQDGNVAETVMPRLVANGKIDLNPQGGFFAAPGATLIITIDFDVGKSLKITETGNGRLIVRPVVFVDVADGFAAPGLARLHGAISDVMPGSFRLCQTALAATRPEDRTAAQFGAPARCVRVRTDVDTGIFGTDGLPRAPFLAGDTGEATVVGRLRPVPATTGDGGSGTDAERFELAAFVIEEGPLGTFRRLRGLVASPPDALTDQFGFDLAPAQGIVSDGPLATQLFPKSRIFSRAGVELGRTDLVPGTGALVDAVQSVSAGGPTVLRAALVVLGLGQLADEVVVSGPLLSVDPAGGQLRVAGATGDRCVDGRAADVFLVTETAGSLSSERGTLADLVAGEVVNVFGQEGSGGCLVAETILARR